MESQIKPQAPKKTLNSIVEKQDQRKMFIFSHDTYFEGVSYLRGDKVINESLINKILDSTILSKKGQLYT